MENKKLRKPTRTLRTLITWAKKYLDRDGSVSANVEMDIIVITNSYNKILELITMEVYENDKLIAKYEYDMEKQKWEKL